MALGFATVAVVVTVVAAILIDRQDAPPLQDPSIADSVETTVHTPSAQLARWLAEDAAMWPDLADTLRAGETWSGSLDAILYGGGDWWKLCPSLDENNPPTCPNGIWIEGPPKPYLENPGAFEHYREGELAIGAATVTGSIDPDSMIFVED